MSTRTKYSEGPVYRTRPLPAGELRGSFLLAESIVNATKEALIGFAMAGIRDGGHEGMVFWAGRQAVEFTVFLEVIVPNARHTAQGVFANAEAVGEAARYARASKLGILCQVHSHPGGDARHSDGDDELILLPFEGMLSVVVPNLGLGFKSMESACVHQYQDSRWVLCSSNSVASGMISAPAVVDLRG